ncbi:capsular biosynthesis protein [Helicobacter burdigaliensis]|uniref:capsular biosynthesis protein n=1 Tax=Helicobacter burdigaliensis TaxID=2315334 RepID=UPI0039E7DFA0
MKKICIVCEGNTLQEPRTNRLITALKGNNLLSVVGIGITRSNSFKGEIFNYKTPKKRNKEEERQLEKDVANKNYLKLVKIPTRLPIGDFLLNREFDVIFCHDLVLLPIVLENKKNAKVIFDAREYYPRQLENNERWLRLFADFNDYLCKTYLPKVDYMYTVCEGIAEEYQKNYGVKCDVITSAAKYFAPPPQEITTLQENIKLIYHGMASYERGIHKMIETADLLEERFSLDLMLVPTNDKEYFAKLEQMAKIRKNVRIIEPVSFESIIPFTSKYDVGFYILQPTNYNGYFALPNKFFEFIQARLAIAIGPSPQMAKYVKEYDLGVISPDFTPKSMSKTLNSLTKEQILKYKENANKAAKILNATTEGEKLLKIVEEVLC